MAATPTDIMPSAEHSLPGKRNCTILGPFCAFDQWPVGFSFLVEREWVCDLGRLGMVSCCVEHLFVQEALPLGPRSRGHAAAGVYQ